MDIYAYSNIEDLKELAAKNGIDCPRLRGYRLMSEEEPLKITDEDIKRWSYYCADYLCEAVPIFTCNPTCYRWGERTKQIKKKYLKDETNEVRWDRIHGRKRKVLKTEVHNFTKRIRKQYEVFNKYIGREDVLMIHSRIGGGNWPCYYKEVVGQPWFIEKVDDAFDDTYCDIYARIVKS